MSSTKKPDGGPAFPFQGVEFQAIHKDQPNVKSLVDVTYPGLTMRDFFAAKAMRSILEAYCIRIRTWRYWLIVIGIRNRNSPGAKQTTIFSYDNAAIESYKMADAMLRAREL